MPLTLLQGGTGTSTDLELPENRLFREALALIMIDGHRGDAMPLMEADAVEVLYRTLANRSFTPSQMSVWIDKLKADDPYVSDSSRDVAAWKHRAGEFIDEAIRASAAPQWITGALDRLDQEMRMMRSETGKDRWQRSEMRWALVHLLTTPAHAPSGCATG